MNFKSVAIAAMFCLSFVGLSNAQSEMKNKKRERPTYAMLLEKMDKNEDGKLAKAEIKGRLKEIFSNIDKDEDGFISEEEFKNAPKPKRRARNNNN